MSAADAGAADGLTFERGRRVQGKTTVTVLRNEGVVFRDTVALEAAKDRRRFAAAMLAEVPADDLPGDWRDDPAKRVADVLLRLGDVPAGAAGPDPSAAGPGPRALLDGTPPAVVRRAEAMLRRPDLYDEVRAGVEEAGVAGEALLAATLYLTGVSRLLPAPLGAIVQGTSSSGKSHVIERVAGLFPPEAVVLTTSMTPQALFHLPPGALRHRWLVCGERSRGEDDDRAEATRALREMLSAGRLTKLMPEKGEAGKIVTTVIEQEGPIAFTESTTLDRVFEEDANRCLLLHTTETAAQTRAVLDATARAFEGGRPASSSRAAEVHHAAQRRLAVALPPGTEVAVPFAARVAELFPDGRVDARRHLPGLLKLTQAAAALHALQRERDRAGRLVAERRDYEIAAELAARPLGKARGDPTESERAFFAALESKFAGAGTFTTAEAKKVNGSHSERSKYGWLVALQEAGLVEQTEAASGRVPARWRLTGEAPGGAAPVVPHPDDVFRA